MNKRLGFLNITVSIVFRIIIIISTLLIKRYLIRFIGNDVNGIYSLYSSIIGVISIAELGIGSAIVFSMYAPIASGDNDRVSALYFLYERVYRIIGVIIFVCGLFVMPFLPGLVSGNTSNINLYTTFFLMLIGTLIGYMYSAKVSLINAYANNYITTAIYSCVQIFSRAIQIPIIIFTGSFTLFLIVGLGSGLLNWFLIDRVTERKYPEIIHNKQRLSEADRKLVTRNVKAMFMHRIGYAINNSLDSIIISAFIGIGILGSYSNYVSIMLAMISVIGLFFNALTNQIGNLYARVSKEESLRYFNFFYTANFMVSCVFFLGYYAIINDLIAICFRSDLILYQGISFAVTINYFIQNMRNVPLVFRNASGTFYYDRWKSFFEALANLVLSLFFMFLLKNSFGESFAVIGITAATIITSLLIDQIIEPYVVFEYAFGVKPWRFYFLNYGFIGLFVVVLFFLHYCMVDIVGPWQQLLANGFIAVGVSIIPCAIAFFIMKDFRYYAKSLLVDAKRLWRRLTDKQE